MRIITLLFFFYAINRVIEDGIDLRTTSGIA
jgi:hypothetical protein